MGVSHRSRPRRFPVSRIASPFWRRLFSKVERPITISKNRRAEPDIDAWILDAVRTPRGRGRADGALHAIHPQTLFATCLSALAERTGFEPVDVDDVIAGNGILSGDHGDDIARLSVLLAGWPETVPG